MYDELFDGMYFKIVYVTAALCFILAWGIDDNSFVLNMKIDFFKIFYITLKIYDSSRNLNSLKIYAHIFSLVNFESGVHFSNEKESWDKSCSSSEQCH